MPLRKLALLMKPRLPFEAAQAIALGLLPGTLPSLSTFILATPQCLVKIDKAQQKIKIVHTNQQSN